jgi:hypothetical protein
MIPLSCSVRWRPQWSRQSRARKALALLVSICVAVAGITVIPSLVQQANAATAWPLGVSENGRYLEDSAGRPFLYTADTAWTLFSGPSEADAKKIIDARVAQGFNALQVVLPGFGKTGFQGGDLTKPDAAYVTKVKNIMEYAADKDVALLVGALWTRNNHGVSAGVGETYGKWIGTTFKGNENVMWFVGGDDSETQDIATLKSIANGIKSTNAGAVITSHMWGGAKPYGLKNEPWMSFYSFQWNGNDAPFTYQSAAEGRSQNPVKPFLNIEPAYDPKACCGNQQNTSELNVRQNGWWSMLAGSLGVVYGGPEAAWGATSFNSGAINRPAATQTGNIRRILSQVAWQKLVPDGSTVTGGSGHIQSGVAGDGSLIVSYTPNGGTLNVNLSKLSKSGTAQWFDPRSGQKSGAAQNVLNSGTRGFQAPGGGDAVLVIRTSDPADEEETESTTPPTPEPGSPDDEETTDPGDEGEETTPPGDDDEATDPGPGDDESGSGGDDGSGEDDGEPGTDQPIGDDALSAQLVSNGNAIAVRGQGFMDVAKADVKFRFGNTVVSRTAQVGADGRFGAIALVPDGFSGTATVDVTAGDGSKTLRVPVGADEGPVEDGETPPTSPDPMHCRTRSRNSSRHWKHGHENHIHEGQRESAHTSYCRHLHCGNGCTHLGHRVSGGCRTGGRIAVADRCPRRLRCDRRTRFPSVDERESHDVIRIRRAARLANGEVGSRRTVRRHHVGSN